VTAGESTSAQQVAPVLAHALQQERLRTGRLFNFYRLIGVTVFFGFTAVTDVVLSLPDWGVNWPLFVAYWLVACGLWLAGRSSDRIAGIAGLAIPLIDMPVVTFLQWGALQITDPGFVYGSNGALLILFIVGSMATLEQRTVVLATAVAVLLQTLLGLEIGPIGATIVFSILMMVLACLGCRYLIQRIRGLVEEATAEQMRRERLGRYFSPEIALLLAGAGSPDSTGESREVTVLFSDLRDFTALTEHLSGPATVALLNAYHERMVHTVFAFGGTLDKFLGDGMMVYFGAPVAQADHAERAVRCALAMTEALSLWNVERVRRDEASLAMGIGIHSGTVIVGDIGAPGRREYTAIGHAVNVASRLQELTKTHRASILVSDDVRRAAGGLCFEPVGTVTVRGHSQPIVVFEPGAQG